MAVIKQEAKQETKTKKNLSGGGSRGEGSAYGDWIENLPIIDNAHLPNGAWNMMSFSKPILFVLLSCSFNVLADTVTGMSNAMMLDTRAGDLSIDLTDPVEGELVLRLSSVWDSGTSGSLCINGVKTKTVGSGSESSVAVDTSGYQDWYFCEWIAGGAVYQRMLRVDYAGKPVVPFVEETTTAKSGGVMLDTRQGDLTIDFGDPVEGERVFRISTIWDAGATGSLCVNGVRVKSTGANAESDVSVSIADCLPRCFCEWTSGGMVYTRIIKPASASTVAAPGKAVGESTGVRLDTMRGIRDIADYWGLLTYDTAWYDGVDGIKIQECADVIAEGTSGTVSFSRDMCGYNFTLFTEDVNGQLQVRERAQFAGGDADCVGAVTRHAVEPTSAQAGSEAEITCIHCGKILHPATVIPPLGYVRNVRVRQLWPYRKVEVEYDLATDVGDVADENTAIALTCSHTYGISTYTGTTILGDTRCTPGRHRVVWSFDDDGISFSNENTLFNVAYGSVGREAGPIAVNLSTAVADGMNVAGTVELGYSPFADGEVKLEIDGVAVLSSTNSGAYAWQPLATGSHTLKHISGDYEWTRTVNVTVLAFDAPPAPNPPTAGDATISIGSTSRAFASGGGSATITTSGSGTWTASASDDWITVPAYSSNTAGRPLAYRVAANSGVEERTGYIYVSGHVFTITQAGVGAELDAYSADFETDGVTGSFTVLVDAQTSWKVRSNVDWISVAVEGTWNGEWGTAGVGEQRVVYNVAPWNEVSTRSGTITAAGCTFTVNQTGRRMKLVVADDGAAGAERQPYRVERDYLSHVIDVQVNALASTDWDIELDGTWISVVDGGTGHGAGGVALAINENPSWLARSGTVRIGTEVLTINQAGRPSAALDFAISPANTTASVKGANGLVSVMATPDLPWTAQSQANWLTIMPAFQSGAGNGNVVYSVSPNPTMAARTGAIRVEAVTSAALPAMSHAVTQPAATAMISADAHTFNAAGESFNVEVTTDDIVNWTISEDCDWISVIGSTSRIGPGALVVSADGNDTVDSRETTVMIAGHQFAVFQKGRTVEVEYESRVFGTASDYATIDVHPDGNVTWVAATDSPDWIVIWGDDGCEYDSDGNVVGTGDHTIEYIVSDYAGDGTPRTGTITIGDKTVYITQRAYELSINPSATTVSGNANEGEVSVPATAGQIWNAIATEPWITVVSGYDSGTGSGTVRYTYTDNDTDEERTGRIIIAGEEYTITQAARQMVAVNATAWVVTASGEQGTGNGGVVSGAGTYDRGTTVTLTATANDGYEFLNWTLPNGSTAGGVQLVVTADVNKEIFANFRRIPVYAVNGESVREGTSKTFTAPADVIDDAGTTKLVCVGTSRYPEKGTSFTLVVTKDISFEWDIWQTNYLVAVSQSSGGRVLRDGIIAADQWVPAGTTIDLTATPDSGKSFFRWNLSNPDNPVKPVENISAHSASLRLCVNTPTAVSAVFGTFDDTLATALDAPALTFTTGGDASWLPVIDATAQTGYTSARSGAIGAEAETWLDTTVEGAGTLSFRWRVDCEKDDGGGVTWDRLAVFTNGVEAVRIDGKTGWQTVELPINGKTTIRWSFYRDDFDEPGQEHENAAWIDGIEWK